MLPDPYGTYGSYVFYITRQPHTHTPPASAVAEATVAFVKVPTFTVSVWASEDCALLNDAVGLE